MPCSSPKHFFDVGGFTEPLPNNFNDVDFCLEIPDYGLRNIWTPYVEMYQFESKSRENTVRPFELASGRALGSAAIQDPVQPESQGNLADLGAFQRLG